MLSRVMPAVGECPPDRLGGRNPRDSGADDHDGDRFLFRNTDSGCGPAGFELLSGQTAHRAGCGRVSPVVDIFAVQAGPLVDSNLFCGQGSLGLEFEQVRRGPTDRTALGQFRSLMNISAYRADPPIFKSGHG